jgi:hypothetical protein
MSNSNANRLNYISILTDVFGTFKEYDSNHDRFYLTTISGSSFQDFGLYSLGTEVAHKSERDQRAAGPHTLQTSVGAQDMQLVQDPKGMTGVLPTDWGEARGNPTAVHLEREAAATWVDTGDASQGTGQEVADNTGVLEEVAAVS